MSLLRNPSFEEQGWRDIHVGGTRNQEPQGWRLTWAGIGQRLLSAGYTPDDAPQFETAETVPECVHKLASQLPPAEQAGGAMPPAAL